MRKIALFTAALATAFTLSTPPSAEARKHHRSSHHEAPKVEEQPAWFKRIFQNERSSFEPSGWGTLSIASVSSDGWQVTLRSACYGNLIQVDDTIGQLTVFCNRGKGPVVEAVLSYQDIDDPVKNLTPGPGVLDRAIKLKSTLGAIEFTVTLRRQAPVEMRSQPAPVKVADDASIASDFPL